MTFYRLEVASKNISQICICRAKSTIQRKRPQIVLKKEPSREYSSNFAVLQLAIDYGLILMESSTVDDRACKYEEIAVYRVKIRGV